MLTEKHILIDLAGFAAQREFRRQSIRRYHARADYENAVSLACNIVSEKELEAFIQWLEIRAEVIVKNSWPEIVAMAKALLKRKSLSGPEAMDVFYGTVSRNVKNLSRRD